MERCSAAAAVRASSSDKLESVFLEPAEPYTMLYQEGDKLVLMHDETFEQTEVLKYAVDEGPRRFLADGVKLSVRSFAGEPLFVALPQYVELKVDEVLKVPMIRIDVAA